MEFSEDKSTPCRDNISRSADAMLLQRVNVVLFPKLRIGILRATRITIGFIFLLSGVGKVLDISSFAETVEQYHILPQQFIVPFSIIVPFAEAVLGVALVLGVFVKTAGIGLSVLLVSFLIAIGKKLTEGTPADCGCGGVVASSPVSPLLLYKDIGLLVVTLTVLFFAFRKTTTDVNFSEGSFGHYKKNSLEMAAVYVLCGIIAYAFFNIELFASLW